MYIDMRFLNLKTMIVVGEAMNYCLGTVQFGTNYGIQENGQPQHEAVHSMLTYALEHGITQFDTASAYGEAEDVLGGYIRLNPELAKKMCMVSKLRPDAFMDSNENEWKQVTVDNARASLSRLGIACFTAYLFHNASFIFDEKAVNALCEVRKEGLAKHIGVSIYTPEEAMKALSYPQIDAIQIPYNLFDRRLDKCGFFSEAISKGVTVYARSSLLQGLAVMNPDKLPNRVAFAKPFLLQYDDICREFAVPKLNAAIGYVAQKQGIDYVVFGVDNHKQLEEYISIEDIQLPDDMIAKIDRVFENAPEKLVNPVLWK